MVTQNPKPIRIGRGSRTDLDALAHHHYLAGMPATIAGVWRAVSTDDGALAGVLVASYPTLNASWRALAWPGRYTTRDKRADAERLNREVRCLSRVIVAPIFRGLGVATALVRHYLAQPLTIHTEAAASMGRVSPFLKHAGMTEYRLPPSPASCRLIDALASRGYRPWHLASETVGRAIERDTFLLDELRRWANAVRVRVDDEPGSLAHAAGTRVGSAPVAYAHCAREDHTMTNETPAPAPREGDMPRPMTFFMTTDERAAIARALRRIHPDPTRALRVLLGLPRPPRDECT